MKEPETIALVADHGIAQRMAGQIGGRLRRYFSNAGESASETAELPPEFVDLLARLDGVENRV